VLANLRARFFASLAGSRIDLRTVEHEGAAAGICATAVSLGADLIVIASHGRSTLSRAVPHGAEGARAALGSVTEKVVRAAACRVLVVPSEAAESHSH
jgi:nucleotide-binding universal stress UspA family protein